jgi:hypothetical protein
MDAAGDVLRSSSVADLVPCGVPTFARLDDADSNPSQPRFQLGQRVTVVLNERHSTPHTGTIRDAIWHHELLRWHYFLEENGKAISKRYLAEDTPSL